MSDADENTHEITMLHHIPLKLVGIDVQRRPQDLGRFAEGLQCSEQVHLYVQPILQEYVYGLLIFLDIFRGEDSSEQLRSAYGIWDCFRRDDNVGIGAVSSFRYGAAYLRKVSVLVSTQV